MVHKAARKAGLNTGRWRPTERLHARFFRLRTELGWPISVVLNGGERTRSCVPIMSQWENLSLALLFLGPEPCLLQHSCLERIC